MDLEKAIDELLSYESTRKSWEKIHNSKEFIVADKLAKALGHSLNSGCSDCLNDLYILAKIYKRDKNKLLIKQEVMNSNYVLFPNKVLSFPKLGIHITNDNLTDEIAKDYLATYPAAKVHFKTIPNEVVKEVKAVKKEVVKEVVEKTSETLREMADRIAEEKGIKKPHWKASDYTLNLFIKENS